MSRKTKAFLQEYIIYEYLVFRFNENHLRLNHIVNNGNLEMKDHWVKVVHLIYTNTRFPDIDLITISNDSKGERVAEVKFITSTFNYHKDEKYTSRYEKFVNNHGCIIVLKHDYLPEGITDSCPIDVYELDNMDFISFVKENFIRLLNRQIHFHEYAKVWFMIQSKNFNVSDGVVPAARNSGRWCPSDNLTGFDLTVGDKVVFVKVSGTSKQNVNKTWSLYKEISEKWTLDELYIAEVKVPIKSRQEYCMLKNITPPTPLWYDETITGKEDKRVTKRDTQKIRWKRVFEFKVIACLSSLNINLKELNKLFPEFVQAIREIYVMPVSRELHTDLYTSVTEYLSMHENKEKLDLIGKLLPVQDISLFETSSLFL